MFFSGVAESSGLNYETNIVFLIIIIPGTIVKPISCPGYIHPPLYAEK